MDFDLGQIVFAKKGRDKGDAFIVVNISGEYIYLVNGINRTLDKPKKKKYKHVQPTNFISSTIKKMIKNDEYMKDSDIRNIIKDYTK